MMSAAFMVLSGFLLEAKLALSSSFGVPGRSRLDLHQGVERNFSMRRSLHWVRRAASIPCSQAREAGTVRGQVG
jgi:hypothetical protein